MTDASGTYRVGPIPNWRENPYLDRFYGHMASIEGVDERPVTWPPEKRDAYLSGLDAIHFHWPENSWRSKRDRATLRSLIEFARFIRAVRKKGLPIFWTVHNLRPHERENRYDRAGRRLLARVAALIICHDRHTADILSAEERLTGRLLVMPHGNYEGDLPPPAVREETFRRLGLDPHRPLLVMLGLMRDYKGIDTAIDALDLLPGAQLLVAGQPHPTFDLQMLENRAADNPDIFVKAAYIADQDMADIYEACDLALLPYRKTTGSGAMLMALTQGRAVVASDLPFFRELLAGHGEAGRLFPPGDAAALALMVKQALALPPAAREEAARSVATLYSWDRCAAPAERAMLAILRPDTTSAAGNVDVTSR